jgi:nifR3 family TIM-barrel protein
MIMEHINIGNVKIEKTLALAPMASVADRPFRHLCMEYGASYCVTEMVSSKGLCYSDNKTAELCTITEKERPCGIQLFGSEPDFMAKSVKLILPYDPDIIDINMGCPVPKVVNNGSGSALLKNIPLAVDIVKAVKSQTDKPVTVKMRIGWDDNTVNALEFANAIEKAGADAIAVHGRTRMQYYSGSANWDIIKQVKENSSVPIIGNGDVTDLESCLKMYEHTHCDLVMVGRGAYGNPFLFEEVKSHFEGKPYTPPTLEQRMETMLYHIRLILENSKCEEFGIKTARKHSAWYMTGLYGSAKFRSRCYSLSSYDDAVQLAKDFIELQKTHICEI